MAATIFYSENGELRLSEGPRHDVKKYKPVALGEPLCVEIRRVALGKTEDWMGDNEILASSWAKIGEYDMHIAPVCALQPRYVDPQRFAAAEA